MLKMLGVEVGHPLEKEALETMLSQSGADKETVRNVVSVVETWQQLAKADFTVFVATNTPRPWFSTERETVAGFATIYFLKAEVVLDGEIAAPGDLFIKLPNRPE